VKFLRSSDLFTNGPTFHKATKMEPSDTVKQFSGRRYINLESYKKNGDPKQTPVQSIEAAGVVYFRTDSKTWKVKRIRRNPHVRIVPSDRNGKPTGVWVEGEAHVLEERKTIGQWGSSRRNMVRSGPRWSIS